MGASRFDVTVRDGEGEPVKFDLYHMSREQRGHFHKEFMRAYRRSVKASS
jgi:hypothetical protein